MSEPTRYTCHLPHCEEQNSPAEFFRLLLYGELSAAPIFLAASRAGNPSPPFLSVVPLPDLYSLTYMDWDGLAVGTLLLTTGLNDWTNVVNKIRLVRVHCCCSASSKMLRRAMMASTMSLAVGLAGIASATERVAVGSAAFVSPCFGGRNNCYQVHQRQPRLRYAAFLCL